MEFSRQEYWSGLPFPSPGDLPNPGIEPGSPPLQAHSLPIWVTREAQSLWEGLLNVCVCVCVCVSAQLLSHVWLFTTPWTVPHQVHLSIGFSQQGYWSWLPFPSPGNLPSPGNQTHVSWVPFILMFPESPSYSCFLSLLHWQGDSLPLSHQGSPVIKYTNLIARKETAGAGEMALPRLFSTEAPYFPGWKAGCWQDCWALPTPQPAQEAMRVAKEKTWAAGRNLTQL